MISEYRAAVTISRSADLPEELFYQTLMYCQLHAFGCNIYEYVYFCFVQEFALILDALHVRTEACNA